MTSVPWSGHSAMPMLASSCTVTPWTTNGGPSAVSMRRASSAAKARSGRSCSSTANSSPPSRASVSPRRSAPPSRRGDLAQQRVAVIVPERVVDLLEAVEVDQQQAGEPAERAHAAGHADGLLVQARAVGQPGERVVQGLVAEPARGAPHDREEREPERAEAAEQQQVERARVVVDRRRGRGVVHVDLEHSRRLASRRQPQRHIDLEHRLGLHAAVIDSALDLGDDRAAERAAEVVGRRELADPLVLVGVDDPPVGREELDVLDPGARRGDAGQRAIELGVEVRRQRPRKLRARDPGGDRQLRDHGGELLGAAQRACLHPGMQDRADRERQDEHREQAERTELAQQ